LFLEEEPKVENKFDPKRKCRNRRFYEIENQNENEVNVTETQEKIETVLSQTQ
jgi:hypothetical protein